MDGIYAAFVASHLISNSQRDPLLGSAGAFTTSISVRRAFRDPVHSHLSNHENAGRAFMKNANIFVGVDLTLVDANGRLIPGATEGLEKLKQHCCHLILWSTCGTEYCQKVARVHGLTCLFEGYAAKPDIIIDDMPSTCLNPFVFNVQQENSWAIMVDRLLEKHIDR